MGRLLRRDVGAFISPPGPDFRRKNLANPDADPGASED